MTPNLLHATRDLLGKPADPTENRSLIDDLNLDVLVAAMADSDERIKASAMAMLIEGFDTAAEVRFAQGTIQEALAKPKMVRAMYAIVAKGLEEQKRSRFGLSSKYPSSVLRGGSESLRSMLATIKRLQAVLHRERDALQSVAFRDFAIKIDLVFSPAYLVEIESHLTRLERRGGTLVSASALSRFDEVQYCLRQLDEPPSLWSNLLALFRRNRNFQFRVPPQDYAGAQALSAIQDQAINRVANAVAQCSDRVENLVRSLHAELAFLVGAINLHDWTARKGLVACIPTIVDHQPHSLQFAELSDLCLALQMQRQVVTNSLDLCSKRLTVITGPNQGGKSSLLRAIGTVFLMTRAGLFVAAKMLETDVGGNIFTHYKRVEDRNMVSGKLDEELTRLSELIDSLEPGSSVLMNESFSSTNDREGSEIAFQVSSALADQNLRVFFVTHLIDFPARLKQMNREDVIFLRADVNHDGTRPFKVKFGLPLESAASGDLYREIFGERDVVKM